MEKTAAERPAVVEKAQEKTEAKTEAKAEAKPDTKAAKADQARCEIRRNACRDREQPAERRSSRAARAAAPREKEKIRVVLPSPIQPAASAGRRRSRLRRSRPRSRPRLRRMSAAMPTIWRALRSSACASTAKLLRARPKRPALPRRPVASPDAARRRMRPRVVAAPALRPLPPPIMVSAPPAAGEPHGQAPPQRPPYAPMPKPSTRAARRRRPRFRSRARSICVPKWRSLPCVSAPRQPPKTCCRRRSRSSTRCCRNKNSYWNASRRCARGRFARLRPWGGARARGRRKRTPWPCRRDVHR